jgi:hypothetical protein
MRMTQKQKEEVERLVEGFLEMLDAYGIGQYYRSTIREVVEGEIEEEPEEVDVDDRISDYVRLLASRYSSEEIAKKFDAD